MLACSCQLPEENCQGCKILERYNAKRRTPETKFFRLVNGKCLPYEQAVKYFKEKNNAL